MESSVLELVPAPIALKETNKSKINIFFITYEVFQKFEKSIAKKTTIFLQPLCIFHIHHQIFLSKNFAQWESQNY